MSSFPLTLSLRLYKSPPHTSLCNGNLRVHSVTSDVFVMDFVIAASEERLYQVSRQPGARPSRETPATTALPMASDHAMSRARTASKIARSVQGRRRGAGGVSGAGAGGISGVMLIDGEGTDIPHTRPAESISQMPSSLPTATRLRRTSP